MPSSSRFYFHSYGLTNFLWFCDAALILTVAGMWMESSLLISMCAVGILIPQCLWLADFGSHLPGFRMFDLTAYMFDSDLPLFTRGLSLFHGWLPLFFSGFCAGSVTTNALIAWTALAAALVLVCYCFTPPAGAHLADPNIPTNLNYTYGFNDQRPQTWINQNIYVIGWLGVLWLLAYWPTHWLLGRIFEVKKPTFAYKPSIRFV